METKEETYRGLIRSAARRLTGYERRQYIAEVTQTLCAGNPRQSERLFGWSRDTAAVGLAEVCGYVSNPEPMLTRETCV